MLAAHFHENYIGKLRWEGSVAHRVEGEVDPAFAAPYVRRRRATPRRPGGALAPGADQGAGAAGHRPRPVRYDDVVKPEMRTGTGELLEPRVYRVGR